MSLYTFWFLYPGLRVAQFYITDRSEESAILPNERYVDDASKINRVEHNGIIELTSDLNKSILLMRNVLARAKRDGLKVMPMGARHSMGKQSFQKGAILLNTLPMNAMEMDGSFLKVQAGARWFEVIRFLADFGLTVEIMQSNADFSVGGTLSVNAHGWQPEDHRWPQVWIKFPSSCRVVKFKFVQEKENTDLFRHILGGYGLFGVILEAWIRPVPNKVLYSSSQEVPVDRFSTVWQQITEEGAELAYGRLSVAPSSFFETVWLSSYNAMSEEKAKNPEPYLIDGKARLSWQFFVLL